MLIEMSTLYSYSLAFLLTIFITYLILKLTKFYHQHSRLRKVINKIPGFGTLNFIGLLRMRFYSDDSKVPSGTGIYYGSMGAGNIFALEGIFRFWVGLVPMVQIYTAKNVEALLSSSKEIEKSDDYRVFKIWLGTGLITSKGFYWKSRRRLLTPTFHFRILDEFQPVFEKHSRILIKKISQSIDEDFVDIIPFLTLCMLDIILETAMGINTSSQETGTSPFMSPLENVTRIYMERSVKPWLWYDTTFKLSPTGNEYYQSVKELHNLSGSIIRKRKEELLSNLVEKNEPEKPVKKNKAFLDLLLEEHFRNMEFSESDVCYEVNTFTFAGHDTTKIAITWCLFLLGHHPEIQEKILEEVEDVLGKDYDVKIEAEHLKSFKYLECCIKESLRLFPSVPFIARELKQDLLIDNKYVVPGGVNCVVNVARLHRDENVFPLPEKYIPERFSADGVKGRSPYAYIPFSAGPRNCIGQRFAICEMKTVLANMVRSFTWTSLDHRDRILVLPEMVGRPYPGVRLKFKKRF